MLDCKTCPSFSLVCRLYTIKNIVPQLEVKAGEFLQRHCPYHSWKEPQLRDFSNQGSPDKRIKPCIFLLTQAEQLKNVKLIFFLDEEQMNSGV
jgi:hypothetical protein